MINKQGLWFLTLFSLILVLSIYYITMPNDLFKTNNSNTDKDNTKEVNSDVSETNYISVLKIELQTEREEQMVTLEQVINSSDSSVDEKNKAYEEIKNLNNLKGMEESIENKIKNELKLNTFVKASDSEISIVVEKKEHDVKLANNIMRLVQKEFTEPISISVKFATNN